MDAINLLAVLACAVSALLLGALWYSPALFFKVWLRHANLTEAEVQAANPAKVYGGSFALMLVAAWVFAMFLGPQPALPFAAGAGASAGACWVAASFGVNYLFERRSLTLFLVNGGYHALQFTLYGVILGLWR